MYIESGIIGVVVGALGTIIGGALAMLIGGRVKEPRPFLAFAGGMMIAVVFFDMLIESAEISSVWTMCAGAAAGGIFFALISPLLPHGENSLKSVSILVFAGIALHNLPEGLAIGSTLVESERAALSLSLLMLVHDIPEGIVVCLPMRLFGLKAKRIFFLAFLTAVPTALGTLLGTAVGSISPEMISLCISFAGGAMLFISLKELIPAAGKQKALYALLGICFGFFVTALV